MVLPFWWVASAATAAEPASLPIPPQRFKVSTNAVDAEACKVRLLLIHDAIKAFMEANQRLPSWLSELSPKYLDAKLLVCPYVDRIGDLRSWRFEIRGDVFEDPQELTSYAYEFCSKEMILWTGVKKTWRQYKRRLMERIGPRAEDAIPVVRCFAHAPVLNLTYNGRTYESGGEWEDSFPEFKHEEMHPEPLFFHEPPRTDARRFPPRADAADPRLIDLSAYYNAYLDEPWLRHPRDRDLHQLPLGTQDFGRTSFDVRGLIQLTAPRLLAPYPAVVRIGLGRSCVGIHFLHGARAVYESNGQAVKVEDGAKVASYVVNYASGAQVEIPVLYGRDVKDAWYNPGISESGPAVWEVENADSVAPQRRIRLFLKSWKNPWKEQPVESLYLVSAMADSAPFIVAITVD